MVKCPLRSSHAVLNRCKDLCEIQLHKLRSRYLKYCQGWYTSHIETEELTGVLWSAARDDLKGHLSWGFEDLVIYIEKGDHRAGRMIKRNVMKNPHPTFNFLSTKTGGG